MDYVWRCRFLCIVVAVSPLFMVASTNVDAAPMADAKVYFEQNATDGDAEVVFAATSGDVGFETLLITSPDERVVLHFKSSDTKLGVRHLQLESPEPEDIEAVRSDYPEGVYTFAGTTVDGVRLTAKATLSHKLPPVAEFVHPLPDAEEVETTLTVEWINPGGMAAIVVSVEQEDDELEVSAKLSGDATQFTVPAKFLRADTKYKLAIGTVAKGGNISYVEAEFSTK